MGTFTVLTRRERLRRFVDRRFGIFAHWGLKSGDAGRVGHVVAELEARARAPRFHEEARDFDAASWAETFRAAGAGYVVFVPRHCANQYHCLYPSALTTLDYTAHSSSPTPAQLKSLTEQWR